MIQLLFQSIMDCLSQYWQFITISTLWILVLLLSIRSRVICKHLVGELDENDYK